MKIAVNYKFFKRGIMLLRGYFIKIFFKKCGRNLFLWKNVCLYGKKNITIGNKVIINDFVEINAEAKDSVYLGNNSNIGKYSIVKCTGKYNNSNPGLKVGERFICGEFCFFGCAGGIIIGDNVMMGQNVRFHAQNHIFEDTNILLREQGTSQKGIIIEDDCWIGAGSVFLDGITVGRGSVIGANTVVTKNVEPYSVVVGNPGKIIKKRNDFYK